MLDGGVMGALVKLARHLGLWVDRTETATRVGAFVGKHCVVDGYADGAVAWARVFGFGIAVKNTRFAALEATEERDEAVMLGPFRLRGLTSKTHPHRLDASAARRLRALARRHAQEVSEYHGGRAVDDLTTEELGAWCAAFARGAELAER
jgi:hypothetical protein